MTRLARLSIAAAIIAGATASVGVGAQAVPRQPQTDQAKRWSVSRLNALMDARARRLDYVPGEVVVRFRAGMGPARQQRALDALRGRPVVSDIRWVGANAVVRDETQPNAMYLAQQMALQPEVAFAEPNYLRRVPARRNVRVTELDAAPSGLARTPNDAFFGELQWNFSLIDMARAWDINAGGKSDVIVAVIDTGVTNVNQIQNVPLFTGASIQTVTLPISVNPDLPLSRHISARDIVEGSGTVIDMDGHGTHVSATIAEETNNMVGVAGIAYQSKIMPVKVCAGYWEEMLARGRQNIPGFSQDLDVFCESADVADGIRYAADNGAKVINLSLGGLSSSSAERDAIAYAVGKDVFVAIAAGNDFEDGNPTTFPASFAPSFNGAMSVAAVTKNELKASYSSTGTWVEIAAPGGDFDDDNLGDDRFVWQVTLNPNEVDVFQLRPRFDQYAVVGYTGTSMASPHVAGLAALLVSQGVTKPGAIEAIIRASARDIGAAGKDNQFGYGLVQPRAALRGLGIRK